MLSRAQEEMKKYADRKRVEIDDYKVEDLVMLSTKDLKYQMVRRRTEKLAEKFVGSYKIKKIVSSNTVELELPSTIKILWEQPLGYMCMILYMSGELQQCFSYFDYSILLFLDTLLTIVSFILDCHADYCGILIETSIVCPLVIFLLFVVTRL